MLCMFIQAIILVTWNSLELGLELRLERGLELAITKFSFIALNLIDYSTATYWAKLGIFTALFHYKFILLFQWIYYKDSIVDAVERRYYNWSLGLAG